MSEFSAEDFRRVREHIDRLGITNETVVASLRIAERVMTPGVIEGAIIEANCNVTLDQFRDAFPEEQEEAIRRALLAKDDGRAAIHELRCSECDNGVAEWMTYCPFCGAQGRTEKASPNADRSGGEEEK